MGLNSDGLNDDRNIASTAESSSCRNLLRLWKGASLVWITFIAWRAHTGWPSIPLDMGGADPATDAAYQAAQVQHVARALGLAVAAPALSYIVGRLGCGLLRK